MSCNECKKEEEEQSKAETRTSPASKSRMSTWFRV